MRSDYVISAMMMVGGSQFRIDLAEPDVFARWAAELLRHYAGSVAAPVRTEITYSGPWPR